MRGKGQQASGGFEGRKLLVSPGMAAWANECEGWLALGEAEESDVYEIGRYEGFVWARPVPGTGYRLPVMLLVEQAKSKEKRRDNGTEPIRERLQRAVDFFGLRGTPLFLALPPEGNVEDWRDAARELKFRHESVQLLMACPLPRQSPVAEPARFDVFEAKSDEEWAAGLEVIADVFRDSPAMAAFYNPRDKVRLFIARIRQEPVAATALWPFAGVAGIYSVATKERYRGLGLAYAVVEYVLQTAQQEGFRLATLRTTGELLSVYLRHGFSAAGQVQRYRLDL